MWCLSVHSLNIQWPTCMRWSLKGASFCFPLPLPLLSSCLSGKMYFSSNLSLGNLQVKFLDPKPSARRETSLLCALTALQWRKLTPLWLMLFSWFPGSCSFFHFLHLLQYVIHCRSLIQVLNEYVDLSLYALTPLSPAINLSNLWKWAVLDKNDSLFSIPPASS